MKRRQRLDHIFLHGGGECHDDTSAMVPRGGGEGTDRAGRRSADAFQFHTRTRPSFPRM